MAHIKTVIFDMDGLMFDTEPIYYKANQKTADKLGMDFSFDTYAQFIGMGDVDYQKTMREIYQDEEVLAEFFEKSNKVLEYLLLNGPVQMKKGLLELLEYLDQQNISAIVASSTNRGLVDQLLKRLDVRKYFKDVIGGDEVTRAKPDPAIFTQAFKKSAVKNKESALILEDSENGVLAAQAAKIPVILIPDLIEPKDEIKEQAVAIFDDLTEVIKYIEEKNN